MSGGSRPSPPERRPQGPHARAVEVISLLANRPTDALSLSEIARQLGLSVGSAHRVLKTLVDARFVARHSKHKTYSLGIALIALGQATLEKHRGLELARQAMARLAVRFGTLCTAIAVVDGEMVQIAREGTSPVHRAIGKIGDRYPLLPPIGLGLLAWNDDAVLDAYLASAPMAMTAAARKHLRRSLSTIRERGFAACGNGDALWALRQTAVQPIGQLRDAAYWDRLEALICRLSLQEIQLLELDDASRGICFMSAPVFSPTGSVAFEVSLSDLSPRMTRSELEERRDALMDLTATLTADTLGRAPE